jgi:UDP-glucose 4-epimerase
MLHLGERLVVTGGAGFIGSHLVDRLIATGHQDVVVFDNLSRGRRDHLARHEPGGALRFVEGDLRDRAALEAALQGAHTVLHLAAHSLIMGVPEDLEETFTSNVVGTFNLLSAAVKAGVRRVVFTSARDVYGEPIALPVDEDHPLMAVNTYGASKTAGEAYCRAFRRKYGLHVVVLRLGNVYGPRDSGHAIPVWLERALAGQELYVHGGKEIIDFLWIDYAVDALVRAAAGDGSLPPINVASGTGTKIIDLARRIVRLVEGRSQIKMLPPDERGVTRFVANVQRMREMLRLDPPLDPLAHLPDLLPPGLRRFGLDAGSLAAG